MRKEVKEIIALPFEVGKTYKTKFATGDLFKVEKLIHIERAKEGKVLVRLDGYYVGKEHIGLCPLPPDRLVTEFEETGRVFEICHKCKTALDKENENLQYR